MSQLSRRIIATSTATFALAMSTMIGTASAEAPDPATFAAPVFAYDYISPENDGGETGYWLHGKGCIGSDGQQGTVTALLTETDGTTSVRQAIMFSDGSWDAFFPTADQGPGIATAAASCDIYISSLNYPVVSVEVPTPPTSLPPISARVDDYTDGSAVLLTFDRCFDNATWQFGDIWYDVQTPSGLQSGFVHREPDSSGMRWEPLEFEAGHWVVNAMCRLDAPWVSYPTVSFDLALVDGTWVMSNVTVGADPGSPTTGQPGPSAGNTPTGGSGTGSTGSTGATTTRSGAAGSSGTKATGPLANTGTDVAPLLLVGGALLLGGATLVASRRFGTTK